VANLAALGHVFPPDRYPFPVDGVLARWRLVLDDPDVEVLVVDDPELPGLAAYAAYDSGWLRHLAVHPDRWCRGLATGLLETVLHAMAARGAVSVSLWCLETNHRALRLYQRLGWRASGVSRESSWPPYPTEVELTRALRTGHGQGEASAAAGADA
jgi:GNAT superfamily N-acetyltransferase